MPYYTEDTAQRSRFDLTDIPSTFSEVIEAQFASTVTELPVVAGKRAAELFQAERSGNRIDQDTALSRIKDAGLEGALNVDANGTTQEALDILIERKRDEMRRADILSRAEGGFMQNTARLGVALGTSLADPVNVASSFIPIVGQAKYARMLAMTRGALGRAGVRAGVGAAEGAAGAALLEPIIYSAKAYEQADYDSLDSLLNVAFGTVFGGGLHSIGGASVDLYRMARGLPLTDVGAAVRTAIDTAAAERAAKAITRETIEAGGETLDRQLDTALEIGTARADGDAARAADTTSPEMREAALRTATDQAMSGEAVNVEPLFAGERGRLPDGTDTGALVPERFDAERQRARLPDLVETLDRKRTDIEQRATAAGGDGKPRFTSRLLRELTETRAQREAVQAMSEGKPLTPEQAERVRQATVTDAVDRGVPVPAAAVEGLPDSVVARAGETRQRAIAEAVRRDADAPDPEGAAQAQRTDEIDQEIRESDDTLEAAEEEARLAEAALAEQAARFGDAAADETIAVAKELADRMTTWARAAELAQVCVLRGG